jgi:hypothetical protein
LRQVHGKATFSYSCLSLNHEEAAALRQYKFVYLPEQRLSAGESR